MLQLLARPWPWYVSGPLIGLFVPLLLLLGNKTLGMSASLRAICAAVAPGRVEFFRYDWKQASLWTIAMALGLLTGGGILAALVGTPTLVPPDIFNWPSLLTVRGAIAMLGGGYLVGFGTSYAGGCTSGHGVMGLASLQLASLIAIMAIFAGGILATFLLVPLVF